MWIASVGNEIKNSTLRHFLAAPFGPGAIPEAGRLFTGWFLLGTRPLLITPRPPPLPLFISRPLLQVLTPSRYGTRASLPYLVLPPGGSASKAQALSLWVHQPRTPHPTGLNWSEQDDGHSCPETRLSSEAAKGPGPLLLVWDLWSECPVCPPHHALRVRVAGPSRAGVTVTGHVPPHLVCTAQGKGLCPGAPGRGPASGVRRRKDGEKPRGEGPRHPQEVRPSGSMSRHWWAGQV